MAEGGFKPYEPPRAAAGAPGRRWKGARIAEVAPGSPAEREGLEPGMLVTSVNGAPLRDMIDWDWEADGPEAFLEGVAYEGTPEEFEFECDMSRELGEDWGITFDGAVFDGMRLCRNDCTFCFMKMLPKGMRRTLYMRDDDYRLSFLQGNFVTLTNLSDDDIDRIVGCALSPLNVSLHAVTPEVRARLMGRNAQRGLDALEAVIAGGVEVHAQVVLVPDVNDGEELRRTLDFVEARPLITSLGIVPLGFTRFQHAFSSSFNDPARSRAVIDAVRPYQRRSRDATGRTRYQLADEFYLTAGIEPPPAEEYDGYPQYYDGIGMVRSDMDEGARVSADEGARARLEGARARLEEAGERLVLVNGEASAGVMRSFISSTPLAPVASVLAVKNDYFGGNVNVTGLLTAKDVLAALPGRLEGVVVAIPDIMLNADGLTLDGQSADGLRAEVSARGGRAAVLRATPEGILKGVGEL